MAPFPAWHLAAHPVFMTQIRRLAAAQDPSCASRQRARLQVLAMLRDLCLHIVPADPMNPEFQPREAERPFCGPWRRVHFGAGRFMLLFRADAAARILVFGHVVDLEAPDPAPAEKQPIVLLGCVCPITPEGQISLPGLLRERLGVRTGGHINMRVGGTRDPVVLEPAGPHPAPLSRLAQRLRAATHAAKHPAPAAPKTRPGAVTHFSGSPYRTGSPRPY
jgi:bifunctional DNA-binding transcriptional regulator/antitoxin component of YhaV-PrlF toxin-antitoxin module